MIRRSYIICEDALNKIIAEIRNEIENGDYTDEGKQKWNREVDFVLAGETIDEKFVRLTHTNIFSLTFGERCGIKNGTLSVESEYFGKGTQNTYFPIFGK